MSKIRIKSGVRIRDVAEAAGVSKTTVSLVANGLADKVGICLATCQRVEAVIRQLSYVPSSAARGMATGHAASPPATPAPVVAPKIPLPSDRMGLRGSSP